MDFELVTRISNVSFRASQHGNGEHLAVEILMTKLVVSYSKLLMTV
jgi:hypothetical protein